MTTRKPARSGDAGDTWTSSLAKTHVLDAGGNTWG